MHRLTAILRPLLAGLALLAVLACSGILGTPQEQLEWGYTWEVEALDELAARSESNPVLQEEVRKAMAEFEVEYAALPTSGTEREDALGGLNTRMQDTVDGFEVRVDALEEEAEATEARAIAAHRRSFNGTWQGGGVTITIEPGGQVKYENTAGAVDKSIDAPIQDFRQDAFVVGFLWITTTFQVDEAPHEVDGVWRMTLDGVALERVSGP